MEEKRDDRNLFDNSKVKELTAKDFDGHTPYHLKSKKCAAVLFYCAWCPHCRDFQATWKKFATTVGFLDVFAVNCEKNKGHILKIKNDMPNLIQGYPTIVFYKNGEPTEHATNRELSALVEKAMGFCGGK